MNLMEELILFHKKEECIYVHPFLLGGIINPLNERHFRMLSAFYNLFFHQETLHSRWDALVQQEG